jgi:spore germination cell wall hydrolase CwlJ-like protein
MKVLLVSAAILFCNSLGSVSVGYLKPVKHTRADTKCLADNIYHEARGEPFRGQLAVAQVTINRFQSGKHGKTICATVHEKKQFSWTITKPKVRDLKRWQNSYTVAEFMLSGTRIRDFDAQFYHTKAVNPGWNRGKRILQVINNHVFYS